MSDQESDALRFNGATAVKPWRVLATGDIMPPEGGFNGATAVKPWRGLVLCSCPTPDRAASTGPRR